MQSSQIQSYPRLTPCTCNQSWHPLQCHNCLSRGDQSPFVSFSASKSVYSYVGSEKKLSEEASNNVSSWACLVLILLPVSQAEHACTCTALLQCRNRRDVLNSPVASHTPKNLHQIVSHDLTSTVVREKLFASSKVYLCWVWPQVRHVVNLIWAFCGWPGTSA